MLCAYGGGVTMAVDRVGPQIRAAMTYLPFEAAVAVEQAVRGGACPYNLIVWPLGYVELRVYKESDAVPLLVVGFERKKERGRRRGYWEEPRPLYPCNMMRQFRRRTRSL